MSEDSLLKKIKTSQPASMSPKKYAPILTGYIEDLVKVIKRRDVYFQALKLEEAQVWREGGQEKSQ